MPASASAGNCACAWCSAHSPARSSRCARKRARCSPPAWRRRCSCWSGSAPALALNSLLSYRLARFSPGNARTIDGYDRLDLSGWNPLWFAFAAGIGEELLFRGALQPLLGLWAATALFVAAHARAYRFRVDRTALAQIATLLAVGLLFGVVARYVGLYAAIVTHVATDLAGLHVVREAASRRILQTAA